MSAAAEIVQAPGDPLLRLSRAFELIGEGFKKASAELLSERHSGPRLVDDIRDQGPSKDGSPLSDDVFVTQRSGLMEKELFLRLAREAAFPSRKVGKQVVARWGDVKAALSDGTRNARKSVGSLDPNGGEGGDLNHVRQLIGLVPKRK